MGVDHMTSLPSDWPSLEILTVHWSSVREKARTVGERPPGESSWSACLGACAVLFPGEPRANFRRRNLEAETGNAWGTVGGVSPGGRERRRGPPGFEVERRASGGRGPRPEAEAEGGAHLREVQGKSLGRRTRCPPLRLSSPLRQGCWDRARGSGRVRVPDCRVLLSDPGESLALSERSLLLGHWRMSMESVPFRIN